MSKRLNFQYATQIFADIQRKVSLKHKYVNWTVLVSNGAYFLTISIQVFSLSFSFLTYRIW